MPRLSGLFASGGAGILVRWDRAAGVSGSGGGSRLRGRGQEAFAFRNRDAPDQFIRQRAGGQALQGFPIFLAFPCDAFILVDVGRMPTNAARTDAGQNPFRVDVSHAQQSEQPFRRDRARTLGVGHGRASDAQIRGKLHLAVRACDLLDALKLFGEWRCAFYEFHGATTG